MIRSVRWNIHYIQMTAISSLQGLLSTLNRYRRLLFAFLVVCLFILYLWPSWLNIYPQKLQGSPLDLCIDSRLHSFEDSISRYDTLVYHNPLRVEEKQFIPFVGNGYIGTVVRTGARLYLKHTRSMSVALNYYPLAVVRLEEATSQEAIAIRLQSGLVNRYQCFQMGDNCVSVSTTVYAHRILPSVLIQEIRIQNPLDRVVHLDLELFGVSDWKGSKTTQKTISNRLGDSLQYQFTFGQITYSPPDQIEQLYMIYIAAPVLPQTITVEGNGMWKTIVHTFIRYTSNLSGKTQEDIKKELKSELEEDMLNTLNIESKMLQESHAAIWQNLWQSGVSISRSLAAGSLNGDRINSTMYYMMSQVRAPLHEKGISEASKKDIQGQLYFPDRCYDGHHTLQNSRLWETALDMESLSELIRTWDITLEKQGCATMIQSGASGVLQAMVLSLGALKFSNHHLEFGLHPSDLHRDYMFRRISYGNNTHVNISVAVNDENRAMMFVALDQNDKPYYACEAACQLKPIHLSRDLAEVPVKLTNPHTAILYITEDKQHMIDLKHAIHVSEIAPAPAHEHHVIALHRHGHHLGGLPALFWVSISVLVLIFHMFLFKLVVNEYCQDMPSRYIRSKYNL